MAKTKALISCAVTAQLICVFVFAYANCWVSHGKAHLSESTKFKLSFSLALSLGDFLDNIDKYIACKLTDYELPKLQQDSAKSKKCHQKCIPP